MPAQSLATDVIVLLKRLPAEAFQMFTVLSVEHGHLSVLQRISRKSVATATPLDLFDEAALLLESSNQGRTWFIRETRLLHRHEGIGRSYDSLRLASAFTALIARNPVDAESRPAVAALVRAALAAFASGVPPGIVSFKSLYRFARDEGYPLKEHWFPSLPSADRAAVAALLNRPVAEQKIAAPEVARLQSRLEEYLRGHTEILLDS